MQLDKYSFGIGDRFAHQGEAQLDALKKVADKGIEIIPVWNKSNREHEIINSKPQDVRFEADNAVKKTGWKNRYFIDADHVNLATVEKFIVPSDFFTIDVADYIGKPVEDEDVDCFIEKNTKYLGELQIPGISNPLNVTVESLKSLAGKYLCAAKEASKVYKYIKYKKGENNFIPEISMDEVELPQSPEDLFFILSALDMYGVPAQTIAPKFSGRFNKGVDYEGNVSNFAREFEEDILVIDFSVKEFGFPDNLKLSVHSGSDKFSIYPVIGKIIKKYNKGIHVKTAGTTWLEEVTGLALAGGEGLDLAKNIYKKAYAKMDQLCAPYATVINIDSKKLPLPADINGWNSKKFADTLRHVPNNTDYNPHFRQLIHVGYKIAANMGALYTDMLDKYKNVIAGQVSENIYERHIKRLFDIG